MEQDEATPKSVLTSMQVFRMYIVKREDSSLDASKVFSPECYDTWLKTRKFTPTNPEKSFQRALSAHVIGSDGRSPFTPREEAAVLEQIRKKERWPCFANSSFKFGESGFRAKGYHEKQAESQPDHPPEQSQGKEPARKQARLDYTNPVEPPRTDHAAAAATNQVEQDFFSHWPTIHSTPQPAFKPEAAVVAVLKIISSVFRGTDSVQLRQFVFAAMKGVFANGFFEPPTRNRAILLMEEVKEDHFRLGEVLEPIVLVIDSTTANFEDRFLAQSVNSVPSFGMISQDFGGLAQPFILYDDYWEFIYAICLAVTNPGLQNAVAFRTHASQGAVAFRGKMKLDTQTGLVVVWGRIA